MTERKAHPDIPDDSRVRPSPSRRVVLRAAGALGAAGLLAACGDGASPGTATTAAPRPSVPTIGGTSAGGASQTGGATATSSPGGIHTSDVPVGGGTIFKDQNFVITQPTAGTFKAFDATCTHMACQVANVGEGKINCACHGSQFSIVDGSVARGPAQRPLPAKQVTVSRTTLTVT